MLDSVDHLVNSLRHHLEDILADDTLLSLTADIVAAHVSNNSVSATDIPTLIGNVYSALAKTAAPAETETPKPVPAVPIRSSIKPDHLICLENGKKVTMLKRYLATNFGLTPDEYRVKWGLPKDYPMVAPDYAERRRSLARAIGLGRKPRKAKEAATPSAKSSPPARRKLGIASAKAVTVSDPGGEAAAVAPAARPARKTRAKAGRVTRTATSSDP